MTTGLSLATKPIIFSSFTVCSIAYVPHLTSMSSSKENLLSPSSRTCRLRFDNAQASLVWIAGLLRRPLPFWQHRNKNLHWAFSIWTLLSIPTMKTHTATTLTMISTGDLVHNRACKSSLTYELKQSPLITVSCQWKTSILLSRRSFNQLK